MKWGSICRGLTWFQLKRAIKNIYFLLWICIVGASLWGADYLWLRQLELTPQDWALNSVNLSLVGGCILLPLVVRSFMPAFAGSGGVEFLLGRTRYITWDVIITITINSIILWLLAGGAIYAAAYGLKIPLTVNDLLLPMLMVTLPNLLLIVAVILVLMIVMPVFPAMLTFWMLMIVICLVPGLAPWGGLQIMYSSSSYPYTLLMLGNRFFCLAGTVILTYIYAVMIKNQGTGIGKTRWRKRQAYAANLKAVIISGRGLVLGQYPFWERIKREVQIIGYSRFLLAILGASLCGVITRYYGIAGSVGIGLVVIWTTVYLSPGNQQDYLIPGYHRQRWSFLILRTMISLFVVLLVQVIYNLVINTPHLAVQEGKAILVVMGWAWLAAYFWPMLTVRILASLFWVIIIVFPGALDMTSSSWWPAVGCLLIGLSLILYRRHLYIE